MAGPKTELQRAVEREEDGKIGYEDYEPDGSGYYVDLPDE
jgi:hypothetical protein